jgi:DNA-binding CsgD family transcriptional regulator
MTQASIITDNNYLGIGLSELLADLSVNSDIKNELSSSLTEGLVFIDISKLRELSDVDLYRLKNHRLFILLSKDDMCYYLSYLHQKINDFTLLFLDEPMDFLKDNITNLIESEKVYVQQEVFSYDELKKKLTKREELIIKYITCGLSGRIIARILNKSEKTVSAQKRSAMSKLGAKSTVDLFYILSSYQRDINNAFKNHSPLKVNDIIINN